MLVTPRLVLRLWARSDAPALFTHASHPEVGPRAGWPAHTSLEESRRSISDVLSAPGTFAITLDGEPVGCVALRPGEFPELGYWVAAPYWGRGIATEAASALIEHSNYPFIIASHAEGNLGSQRVLLKLGFRFTHTGEKWLAPLGVSRPSLFYALSR
ncbi:GNAT family N-acetyltransferase [Corynebacterium lipophiloflavum]|uniref:Acetyltransferase, GNAT family n=1 Tax=Corynebacterium lipophiloflavum (strain ATCC 700352 / DSM 44291 / CCUG 37336 / JCM 10383 / DMMZ 1944) TaxID=525263 RepID=C0XPY7_CORLD|nr:GNAT family N-acetyltransferase [Corynebacterium lipophiloflavum]EEI17718.1 acetyltransferase, GNAT family [Corynebacterium lipophiloflavum DSM 44291]